MGRELELPAVQDEIGTYLSETAAGDEDDVDTVRMLAERASLAIDHERASRHGTAGRHDLERALHATTTATEIADAVGNDTDLPRILKLVAKSARALVQAGALLIWLPYGDELRIAAVSGDADVPGDAALALDASTAGAALRAEHSVRVDDVRRMQVDPSCYGMPRARSALIVPLVYRGRAQGVLMAFDRRGPTVTFSADDQRTLEAFASSAATAVATAHSVERQRLRDMIDVAESERRRWARELHDETLQGLAAVKLTLAEALAAEPDRMRVVLASAVAQVDRNLAGLRGVIADLRPSALDELGLEPALRTLVARVCRQGGLEAQVMSDLGGVRLEPEIETIAYRVAQEALTNVVKHAGAGSVVVNLRLDAAGLRLTIDDDGRGVAAVPGGGLGIIGMRERAALAGGTLQVTAGAGGGARVTLELPPGELAVPAGRPPGLAAGGPSPRDALRS